MPQRLYAAKFDVALARTFDSPTTGSLRRSPIVLAQPNACSGKRGQVDFPRGRAVAGVHAPPQA